MNAVLEEISKIGITITGFNIQSFSYPEEVQKMVNKVAGQGMVGDVNKYQQIAMADSMSKGNGGSSAADMAGMMMGMQMGSQMAQQMNLSGNGAGGQSTPAGGAPKFCPNCGTPTNGARFCSNCGTKLC